MTATYRTDEWGVPTTTTGSSNQPFRFTGEPQDATGLTYLRARYYDPSLGRFMSRDTWAGARQVPASLNRYSYAGNNPLFAADPSGHFLPLLALGLIAAGGALAGGTAYTVAVGVSNAAQDKPLMQGWNPKDAVISSAAGATSALVATPAVGLSVGGLLATNAIIGFDATVASMALGGRRDPAELVIGTAFGAAGAIPLGGSGVNGFFRGLVSGSFLTVIQNLLNPVSPSTGSSSAGCGGSRVLGSLGAGWGMR